MQLSQNGEWKLEDMMKFCHAQNITKQKFRHCYDLRKQPSLSYADAGVNIDEGNALVADIGPLAKSTRRAGADGALGGFGGLFDLKAAGFKDPILVAANDGVGTKVMIAIETGKHDTVGIDLVAMCVNDLIVQGAKPLFFWIILPQAN